MKADNAAGVYKGMVHIAYPNYSQYISKNEYDMPVTFNIGEDGKVSIDYSNDDSVSVNVEGVYTQTSYVKGSGQLNGTINSDMKIVAAGSINYSYRTEIPSAYMIMMPDSYKALLSGTATGTAKTECQLDTTTGKISGTMSFTTNDTTTTGTVKAEKAP